MLLGLCIPLQLRCVRSVGLVVSVSKFWEVCLGTVVHSCCLCQLLPRDKGLKALHKVHQFLFGLNCLECTYCSSRFLRVYWKAITASKFVAIAS